MGLSSLLFFLPKRSQWLWIALAPLPFLAIYLIHFHCLGSSSTGFVQADQAYYLANGRAIFDRGNGLLYPNPFDADPASPSIYFHWPMWLGGFLVHFLSLDPGVFYVGIGVVAAFLFSLLTWELVGMRVKEERWRPFCFLFVMWGGGLFFLASFSSLVLGSGTVAAFDPLSLDPFQGYWFMNWGRNLIFSYETIYHALVMAVWICLLREKWKTALVFIVATLSAHPFTGVTLLAGLLCWMAAMAFLRKKEKIPGAFRAGVILSLLGFGAYYFLYLAKFPEHRQIMRQWALPWTMSALQNFLALVPVLVFAALFLFGAFRLREKLSRASLLFLCFFATSFLLSNHNWFVNPVQPLHFTRGYVWFPLALLGLPALEGLLKRLPAWRPRSLEISFLAVLLFLASLDNLSFLFQNARNCAAHIGLRPEARAIFRRAEAAGLRGTLHSTLAEAGLLAPTYSKLVPFVSHMFLTPNAVERQNAVVESYRSGQPGKWLASVDYLLIDNADPTGWFNPAEWEPLFVENRIALLRRRNAAEHSPLGQTSKE